MRITWALGEPQLLSDPELVEIPTHQPDATGQFGRVEYVASHCRPASAEEVAQWREWT